MKNAWHKLFSSRNNFEQNRFNGSKVMGEKLVKMAVFHHFLQFFVNISRNMIDREKFIINSFVGNSILRNLKKKFMEIGPRGQELWSK
jgi:hypothetical protein